MLECIWCELPLNTIDPTQYVRVGDERMHPRCYAEYCEESDDYLAEQLRKAAETRRERQNRDTHNDKYKGMR